MTKKDVLPFSVIESRWFPEGNHTVKPIFEAIASIYYENPSAFFHDTFTEKKSLDSHFSIRGMDKTTEVIYLATHGDEKNNICTQTQSISRTELRNTIENNNTKKQIKGLFFGTCFTGNQDIAGHLLEYKHSHLEWVAGSSEDVDWIDGTAIDMIFFSKLAEEYKSNKKRKKGKYSARKMAHIAATELLKIVPGAFTHYGFNIFFHERNKLTSMFISNVE